MEQYLTLDRRDTSRGVRRPETGRNVDFQIKCQFLRELRDNTFLENENEDAHEHMGRILEIASLFNTPGVLGDAIMLPVFPSHTIRIAKRWLNRAPSGTINTWDLLKRIFILRFCPPSKNSRQLEEIHNFRQEEGLCSPKPISTVIEMTYRSIQSPKGIVENVMVKIDKFIFHVDFVMLDIMEDNKVPIILGRPMLATAHAMIDVLVPDDFRENLEEFLMNDNINRDLGDFLEDNDLLPGIDMDSFGVRSDSNNEMRSGLDDLGERIEDFWDAQDPVLISSEMRSIVGETTHELHKAASTCFELEMIVPGTLQTSGSRNTVRLNYGKIALRVSSSNSSGCWKDRWKSLGLELRGQSDSDRRGHAFRTRYSHWENEGSQSEALESIYGTTSECLILIRTQTNWLELAMKVWNGCLEATAEKEDKEVMEVLVSYLVACLVMS
ncbi:protein kinase-like domain, concanavalin A-like lectin/glucanase domain protein [Tanacetum coccineum]